VSQTDPFGADVVAETTEPAEPSDARSAEICGSGVLRGPDAMLTCASEPTDDSQPMERKTVKHVRGRHLVRNHTP
jgi:hypothetical protein